MDRYIFKIKSAKGVSLNYIYQELNMIIEAYKTENETTKIQHVPTLDCILLTSDNPKLRTALLKDDDFILS